MTFKFCNKQQAVFIICALPVLAGCGETMPSAELTDEDCRRVSLVDQETGLKIRGAEDIAVDPEAGIAIISAYDRWAVEQDMDDGRTMIPQGGLYLVTIAALRADRDTLTVTDLANSFKAGSDFHPHGIDLHIAQDGRRILAVINRRYQKGNTTDNNNWQQETTLEIFRLQDLELQHQRTVRHERLCRANGIVLLSSRQILFSRDHGACDDRGALLEDIFGSAKGEVVQLNLPQQTDGPVEVENIAERLGYANGLAVDRNRNQLFVAATRESAVHVYDLDAISASSTEAAVRQIDVTGGPDNLTLLKNGDLLAAVHPSLLSIGLYRRQWLGRTRAPSRILRLNPQDGSVRVLWQDADGSTFSAASVAVSLGPYLLIGSVADDGLMVCRYP